MHSYVVWARLWGLSARASGRVDFGRVLGVLDLSLVSPRGEGGADAPTGFTGALPVLLKMPL